MHRFRQTNASLISNGIVIWCLAGNCCLLLGQARSAELTKYVNAKAGFEALMPPNPQYNRAGTGSDLEVQHQFLCGSAMGVYMVAYQDHPNLNAEKDASVAEKLFVTARDAFQRSIGGERTEYKKVEIASRVGREMHFKIPARSGESRSRMFFANKRWYHVFAMGSPSFVNSDEARRFLDSFRIIDPKQQ